MPGIFDSIRRFSASVILSVLYGNRAPRLITSDVTGFLEVQGRWDLIMAVGALPPIDIVPILKKVLE
jgi:hypothetical protein